MGVSTLNISFTDLKKVTGRELGYGPAESDWSSDTTKAAHVADVVKAALRRVYNAHDWNWLRIPTTITVWGSITGTIQAVNGVGNLTVTASASVFHPTCVGKTLVADTSENEFTIATYVSGTQVTTATTALAEVGDTFTITADGNYQLPDDFAGMDGGLYYQDGTSYAPVKMMGQADVLRARAGIDATGFPEIGAVRWMSSTNATFQKCEVMLYPLPDQDYTLNYRYRKQADALVASTNEYPYGHAAFSELFRVACLATAEEDKGVPGIHSARFPQLLAEAIRRDGQMSPQSLGTPGGSDFEWFCTRGGRTRYNGSL